MPHPDVRTWYNPVTQMFHVQVKVSETKDGNFFRTPTGIAKVDSGEQIPDYLRIPYDIALAIGINHEDAKIKPEATEAHLEDAIGQRNRLFTLLEAAFMDQAGTAASVEWIQGRVGS